MPSIWGRVLPLAWTVILVVVVVMRRSRRWISVIRSLARARRARSTGSCGRMARSSPKSWR